MAITPDLKKQLIQRAWTKIQSPIYQWSHVAQQYESVFFFPTQPTLGLSFNQTLASNSTMVIV
jgi:hypothetical protein